MIELIDFLTRWVVIILFHFIFFILYALGVFAIDTILNVIKHLESIKNET